MRRLDADEATLWARVVATIRPLEPLKPRSAPPKAATAAPPKPAAKPAKVAPPTPPARIPEQKKPARAPANTLDGGWDRRLSRGIAEPSMTVDLHGHTLSTAHATLDAALDRAVRDEHRLVLLVTGKARRDGSGRGAIARAVGDWLAASRHAGAIAAIRGAHPRHGGSGALYIVMRRRRA